MMVKEKAAVMVTAMVAVMVQEKAMVVEAMEMRGAEACRTARRERLGRG